jgi:hypothetical protein
MEQQELLPFYKVLEVLENRRQWSERDVLARLSVPRTTYRSWRYGPTEPCRRIHWIKLSEAFNVSIDNLIRGDLAITLKR